MNTVRIGRLLAMTLALAMLSLSGCNEGPGNNPSPIDLVASVDQAFQLVDVTAETCEVIGEVTLRPIIKNAEPADTRFLDVRLRSYRVSYRRTDGGTLAPAPFTRTISLVLLPDTTTAIPLRLPVPTDDPTAFGLLILEPGALTQAPFAALRGSNGGVDPETGRRTVTLEAIIDFFGETLSGEDVSARARMEYTACVGCGACGSGSGV